MAVALDTKPQAAPVIASSDLGRLATSPAHLLHRGLHIPGVSCGHGLQRDAVLGTHLDGPNLQAGRRWGGSGGWEALALRSAAAPSA